MKHFYEQPWYFAHIPKSGGTTFTAFFDRLFAQELIFPHQLLWQIGHMSQEKHQTYQLFRGHFNALGSQIAYKPTRNITILRDPVAMAFSSYKHTLRDKNTKLHEKVAGEKWSFEDFIFSEDSKNLISNRMTKFLYLGHGVTIEHKNYELNPNTYGRIKRQTKKKQNRPNIAEKFEIAMAFLKQCFWVGVLEDLSKSMDVLCMKAALPPVSTIPVLNPGPKEGQISTYSLTHLKSINQFDYQLLHWAQDQLKCDYNQFFGGDSRERLQTIDHSYRNHHCQLFQKNQAKQIQLTMNQAIFGDQWHQREYNPEAEGYFRWSGPGRHAFIDFWLDRKDYTLEMTISNHCLTGWDELAIDANQKKITYTVNKIGNVWKIGAKIYQSYIEKDGFLRLSLIVEKTKKHSDVFDSNDNRLIGVALNQVVIK